MSWMVRHGDLLLERVEEMPAGCEVRKSGILLDGEATGHAHRLSGGVVLEKNDLLFAQVKELGFVTHEEHATIELPAGNYIVTHQREYDPYERAARAVQD